MAVLACDENIAGTVIRARGKHRTKLHRHAYQHVANTFIQVLPYKSASRALPDKFNFAAQVPGKQFSDPVIKALRLPVGERQIVWISAYLQRRRGCGKRRGRNNYATYFKEAQKHKAGLLCWCILEAPSSRPQIRVQRWDRVNPVLRKRLLLPSHQRRRE